MSEKLESSSKPECSICIEPFTKSTRKKVTCNNQECRCEVCVSCIKTYMKSTINDPHCMKCKFGWTYEFLGSFLTKTYLCGEYKKNRESVLVDREINLLPQSQEAAERQNKDNALCEESQKLRKQRKQMKVELHIMTRRIHNIIRERGQLRYNRRNNNGDAEEEKKERRVFIKPCPAEECRGFLSTQWKCGICEVFVCPKCHEIIGHNANVPNEDGVILKDTHECDEDAVKTAEMLKKDSKGCPKCGVMIFKIHGCDQMWCTSCNTAFSWNTLKILVNNAIHNPHYFEFMRRLDNGEIARNPLDIQCGGLPNAQDASRILKKVFPDQQHNRYYRWNTTYDDNGEFSMNTILNLIQRATHIEQVEIAQNYRVRDDNSNEDLRVKYLLKTIDKDIMAKTIVQREKKNNHNQMISQILNMFVNVANDIIQRILNVIEENEVLKITVPTISYNDYESHKLMVTIEKEEQEKVKDIIQKIYEQEAHALRDYYNECMQKMSKRFNISTPRLSETWNIKRLKT